MKILCPIRKLQYKRKHALQITALSIGFSQVVQWARRVSQGPEELSLKLWIAFFLKLNFYIVQYKSLSLHEVNKPSTESYVVAVRHSMQIDI